MAKDNFDGIPDADLSSVKADLEKQDLGQFTSTEDLLASYKEIQAAFTRVSQENKSLKDQTVDSAAIDQLKAELEDARLLLSNCEKN